MNQPNNVYRFHRSIDNLKAYPESALLEDVKQTLITLQSQNVKMLRLLKEVQHQLSDAENIDHTFLHQEITLLIYHMEKE